MKKIVSSKNAATIYSTKVSGLYQLQPDGSEKKFHQLTDQIFFSDRHIVNPVRLNSQPLFVCSLIPSA